VTTAIDGGDRPADAKNDCMRRIYTSTACPEDRAEDTGEHRKVPDNTLANASVAVTTSGAAPGFIYRPSTALTQSP